MLHTHHRQLQLSRMDLAGGIKVVHEDPLKRTTFGPEDDWVGLPDAKERRKRQNRLHQRAWRQKKASQKASAQAGFIFIHERPRIDSQREISTREVAQPVAERCSTTQGALCYRRELPNRVDEVLKAPSRRDLMSLAHVDLSFAQSEASSNSISQRRSKQIIPPVIPYLDVDSPPTRVSFEFNFPLSPDHFLITLIQYNVLRATLANMHIMSLLDRLPPECQAALSIPLDTLFCPSLPCSVPPSMQPTAIQQAVPHEYWIDLMPIPALRDNVILNYDRIDDDEMCEDFTGGLWEGYDDIEKRGVILWGEPWNADAWEVTEGFARKWPFLLKGCDELLTTTNRWRDLRGEEHIVFAV
ncbi:hypothetical protein BX600DRAFT_476316 [Xylariales sp. PMI_506]|nr:hypothetical protein BX600DRAFT_476316 [Xylariales sp. PMI_506]